MVGKPVFGVSYVVKPKRTVNGKLTRWPHDFTPSCLSKRSENTSMRRPDRERSRPYGSRRPQSGHDPDVRDPARGQSAVHPRGGRCSAWRAGGVSLRHGTDPLLSESREGHTTEAGSDRWFRDGWGTRPSAQGHEGAVVW